MYIAGQVAWDADNSLDGRGDFETQACRVFTNLVAALEAAGADAIP